MIKRTFLGHDRPLLTTMIRDGTPDGCIATVKNAIFDGTNAFGLHISCLGKEWRTPEQFHKIFTAMGQRPVYLTNYRCGPTTDATETERMEMLITALASGGTLMDLVGDTFCPTPGELTFDKAAVARQKEYIARAHEMGKEVLISSHVLRFLPPEEVLETALAQEERGADIAKIVVSASTEEEELANMEATALLHKKLHIPHLLLSCGSHYKIHRLTGGMLGNCMVLCVQQHDASSAKCKPVLRAMKQIYSVADWTPDVL